MNETEELINILTESIIEDLKKEALGVNYLEKDSLFTEIPIKRLNNRHPIYHKDVKVTKQWECYDVKRQDIVIIPQKVIEEGLIDNE